MGNSFLVELGAGGLRVEPQNRGLTKQNQAPVIDQKSRTVKNWVLQPLDKESGAFIISLI